MVFLQLEHDDDENPLLDAKENHLTLHKLGINFSYETRTISDWKESIVSYR